MPAAAESDTNSFPYAAPRHELARRDCYFYHTMELPGIGLVEGPWDLRDDVDGYLGHLDLRGRRVLELGTASGFLCFEMERRGADVVAFDLGEDQRWDMVPFARHIPAAPMARPGDMPGILGDHPAEADQSAQLRRLHNGWWLAHRLLHSRARVVYGNIYDVPEAIGSVDVATFGCILMHLENPLRALERATRLVTDTVIITEHDYHWRPFGPEESPRGWRRWLLQAVHALLGDPGWRRREAFSAAADTLPLMKFLPSVEQNGPHHAWWHMRPALLQQFLGVLGFPETTLTYHTAKYNGRREPMFTLIGKR